MQDSTRTGYAARIASSPRGTQAAKPSHRKATDQFVQSFARGLSVITVFGPDARAMTLSEVAERTGLTRAAARRILLTLQTLGYVRLNGRRFFLTPQILDLGYSYLSSMELWDFAEPIMEELVAKVHESCSASVLDGTDIIYVLRVPTSKIMRIGLSIGSRLPAYATSMGRVLLGGLTPQELDAFFRRAALRPLTKSTVVDPARLKKIIAADRKKGFSFVNQELEEGLCSIAVPIIDGNGAIIAAMNVSKHASPNCEAEMVNRILPQLKSAAVSINTALRLRRR
jgi:IclR family transcriptional regulator, pca regulon regulatory protein